MSTSALHPPPQRHIEILYPTSLISNFTVRYEGPENISSWCPPSRYPRDYAAFPKGKKYTVTLEFDALKPAGVKEVSFYTTPERVVAQKAVSSFSGNHCTATAVWGPTDSQGHECIAGMYAFLICWRSPGGSYCPLYVSIVLASKYGLRLPKGYFDMTIAPAIGVTIGDSVDWYSDTMKPLYFRRF